MRNGRNQNRVRVSITQLIPVVVSWFLLSPCLVEAAIILEVDFDGLAPGVVTKPTLDAATMGGSWILNSDPAVAHAIEADVSGNNDLAYLSSAGSAKWGAQLVLDNPVDIDAQLIGGDLQIDFETATRDS
ncbi:MAG: hypothetical protein N2C14_22180, partial [Planctomycetales bacterium]